MMQKLVAILFFSAHIFFAFGDLWCHVPHEDNHTHLDHHTEHIHAEDFAASLFLAYHGEENCTIDTHGLEDIAIALAIGEDSHEHDHDHYGVDSLQKSTDDVQRLKRKSTKVPEIAANSILQKYFENIALAVDEHDHEHEHHFEVSHNCYTVADLLDIFNFTEDAHHGLTKAQFESICPALLQQHLEGCTAHEEHASSPKPSDLEMYGLSSLANLVICLSSLLGLVVYRWKDSPAYNYIISGMLGLSIGALVGDAALHLVPQALGLHSHGSGDGHDHDHDHAHGGGVVIEDYTWKMFLSMVAMWGFFMLQMGLEYASYKSGGHGHSHGQDSRMNKVENGHVNPAFVTANGDFPDSKAKNKKELDISTDPDMEVAKLDDSVAWMVVIGDGIHNFTDGLTLGASFAIDWRTGMATSIAILCHELPHEFGDIAVLLASGWSVKKVALLNFFSACISFLGLYIGIPVSTALDAETWFLAVAMGMFLYIGLANIAPELMENFKQNPSLKLAFISNFGIFIGFLMMFLIAIYEDQISF